MLNKLLDNAREAMPDGGTLTVRTSDLQQRSSRRGAGRNQKLSAYFHRGYGRRPGRVARSRMFEPFFTRGKMLNPPASSPPSFTASCVRIAARSRSTAPRDTARASISYSPASKPSLSPPSNSPPEPRCFGHGASLPPPSRGRAGHRRDLAGIVADRWLACALGSRRERGTAGSLFRAHRDEIALVFTDVGLPLIDGWQVADAVRKEMPSMPLLIASGAFRHGDRQRGYAEPVAYLSKP